MTNLKSFAAKTVLGLSALALIVPAQAKSPIKPVVAEGIVAGTPESNAKREFNLRYNGQVWRVHVHSGVSLKGVNGGDSVRVYGRPLGQMLTDANVRVLASRDSSNPSDYAPPTKPIGR